MNIQERLDSLDLLVGRLRTDFENDFLGAMLLSHRIGREARAITPSLDALPEGEEKSRWSLRLKYFLGFGS